MKRILILTLLICLSKKAYSQCTLNNSGTVSNGYLASTGNSEIDNLIKSEKSKLEKFFNVTVDLKIYSGSNGLARRNCQNSNCNGTIELGKDLLSFEFKKKGPVSKESIGKYMISSILAHEFAHIFQYSHPEYVFKNNVTQEIHADLLAGYYMSRYFTDNATSDYKFDYQLNKKISDRISDMAISFGWMGDTQYWSQQHHGNYFSRANAFKEPWRCLDGRPTKYSCYNFSDFLRSSVQNAEYIIYSFDND
jgi:hypothetical protein